MEKKVCLALVVEFDFCYYWGCDVFFVVCFWTDSIYDYWCEIWNQHLGFSFVHGHLP